MTSTIIWVLAIGLHGGYQSMHVRITFPTEARCEAARTSLVTSGAGQVGAMCVPQRAEQPPTKPTS